MSTKELSPNEKLFMFVVSSSDDPEVFREISTDPLYAKYQSCIDHISIRDESQETHVLQPSATSLDDTKIPLDVEPLKEEAKEMNTITRNELDSKLSAVEAKMDLRVEKFSNSMQQVISELRLERADRDAKVIAAVTDVNAKVSEINGRLEPLKDLKMHIWAGVIGIAAVIIASIALSATSFDSGRNTTNEIQGVRQELIEKQNRTDQSLQEISKSLKELSKAMQKPN